MQRLTFLAHSLSLLIFVSVNGGPALLDHWASTDAESNASFEQLGKTRVISRSPRPPLPRSLIKTVLETTGRREMKDARCNFYGLNGRFVGAIAKFAISHSLSLSLLSGGARTRPKNRTSGLSSRPDPSNYSLSTLDTTDTRQTEKENRHVSIDDLFSIFLDATTIRGEKRILRSRSRRAFLTSKCFIEMPAALA